MRVSDNSMRTIENWQCALYQNTTWGVQKAGPLAGRMVAIPACTADAVLEIAKPVIFGVQNAAFAIFNLAACAFSKDYSLKDALYSTEMALGQLCAIPITVVSAVVRAICILAQALLDPTKARPMVSFYESIVHPRRPVMGGIPVGESTEPPLRADKRFLESLQKQQDELYGLYDEDVIPSMSIPTRDLSHLSFLGALVRDAGLEIAKPLIFGCQNLKFTALNLYGSAVQQPGASLKGALYATDEALRSFSETPAIMVGVALRGISQAVAILKARSKLALCNLHPHPLYQFYWQPRIATAPAGGVRVL